MAKTVSFAVQHLHLHGRFEMRESSFYLPALAVQLSEVRHAVALCVEERGHERDLASAETRRTDLVTDLAEH
jgi:hypothetical protein